MKAAQAIACAAFAVGVLDFYFYIKGTFLLSRFLVTKRRVQGGVATSERRRRDRGRTLLARENKHKDTFFTVFFSLVRKERKGQKEESFDSRLGDADTHASHMCQSLF